ncbi:MAG: response regulator [Verrucomicrobiota bacterium]
MFKWQPSFPAKLSLIATGLLLACSLLAIAFLRSSAASEKSIAREARVLASAEVLASLLESDWEQYSKDSSRIQVSDILNDTVSKFPAEAGQTNLKIWKRTENGTQLVAQSRVARARSLEEWKSGVPQKTNLLSLSFPIRDEESEILGFVQLEGDSKTLSGEADGNFALEGALILLVVSFIVGLSYFFVRQITAPLAQLASATEKVSEGELHYRIEETPNREFTALFSAFNQMISGLEQASQIRNEHEKEMLARQEELISARDRAESKIKAKDDFLATMSHEIRTPTTGIIGLPEILQQSIEDPEQRKILNTVVTSGNSLMNIVNDILDFSKIEAGRLELSPEAIDLREFLNDITLFYQPLAFTKEIEMKSVIDDRIPDHVLIDGHRLRQVLTNLISNAIKFTKAGYVALETRVLTLASESVRVKFAIRDTGIGIDGEGKKRLFKSFSQADSSTSRDYGGTGLGLVISQSIIEMMDSKIGLESKPGRGSNFTFVLDLPIPASEMIKDQEAGAAAVSLDGCLKGYRALIADDSQVNRLTVQLQMEKLGCELRLVTDGKQALAAVKNSRFDFVLMDVSMPEMDGLEATRRIREYEKSNQIKSTPIIAMTANAFAEQKRDCISSGMDDFLSKPVKCQDIAEKAMTWIAEIREQRMGKIEVNSIVKTKPKSATAPVVAEESQPNETDLADETDEERDESKNPESGYERIEDFSFLDSLGDTYGEDVSETILAEFLIEGRKTLNAFVEAHESADLVRFGKAAHKLKGDVNIIGHRRMGAELNKLQDPDSPNFDPSNLDEKVDQIKADFEDLCHMIKERVGDN